MLRRPALQGEARGARHEGERFVRLDRARYDERRVPGDRGCEIVERRVRVDRCERCGLVEHDRRVVAQVVERRCALVVARRFVPRRDGNRVELFVAALRFEIESANGLDGIAEELDANRCRRGCGKAVENSAAHRVLAGRTDNVDALVAEIVKAAQRRFPIARLAAPDGEAKSAQALGRHDVLTDRRNAGDDDDRRAVGERVEERDARAALARALQRAEGIVARAQQRHRPLRVVAEVVEKVRVDAFGNVGGGNDAEERSPQCPGKRCEERRPGVRGRLVQGGGVASPQAFEDGRSGPALRDEGGERLGHARGRNLKAGGGVEKIGSHMKRVLTGGRTGRTL